MRVHDLFVTDYNYALQSDIKQTFIRVTEDEKINAFDNKKMKIHQKIRNNNQVADIIDDNDFSDRGFIEEVDEEMKEFSDVSYADVSSSIGADMEEE